MPVTVDDPPKNTVSKDAVSEIRVTGLVVPANVLHYEAGRFKNNNKIRFEHRLDHDTPTRVVLIELVQCFRFDRCSLKLLFEDILHAKRGSTCFIVHNGS